MDAECRFVLTRSELLIANNGAPFSRTGVMGICAAHLGTKEDIRPIDNFVGVPDAELPKAILERELSTYKNDPNRLLSDFRGDDETGRSYSGRALWELLQNADDAAAPPTDTLAELIGAKGLGFRSTLEWSDEPEIHSSSFHFRFSARLTQALLRDQGIAVDPPHLIFRLPHDAQPDGDVQKLLDAGFSTVIRLPLREDAFSKIEKTLREFDPRCLLFMQHLNAIEIEVMHSGEDWLRFEIERKGIGFTDDIVSLVERRKHPGNKPRRFRVWADTVPSKNGKRHSAALILGWDDDRAVVLPDAPPLHVFFPTDEELPFRAMIHGSFDLDPNRKHIQEGPHTDKALELLGGLLKRAIDEVSPVTVLTAFVPGTQLEKKDIAHLLWGKFEETLQTASFIPVIGGEKGIPNKTRLWLHDLGKVLREDKNEIHAEMLVVDELNTVCRQALITLGAQEQDISTQIGLLRHCRNSNTQECVDALDVLYRFVIDQPDGAMLSDFQAVPCWWTAHKNARALTCHERGPLFESKQKNDEAPAWLDFDVLDERFLGKAKQKVPWRGGEWPKVFQPLLEWNSDNLLYQALVPGLKKRADSATWWETNGGEVLNAFFKWCEENDFEEIPPVIWNSDKRIVLALTLRVPTDKGWLTAEKVYAGAAWDGFSSHDSFFVDKADRGVLLPPDDWPCNVDVNGWKPKLRFVGVSWEPKLLRVPKTSFVRPKNPFPDRAQEGWKEYSKEFEEKIVQSNRNKNKEMDSQWIIEYWPESLGEFTSGQLPKLWGLVAAFKSTNKFRRAQFSIDGKQSSNSGGSFAWFQLREISWLPCKPALLHHSKRCKPTEAYFPEMGLNGLLPEVDFPRAPNNTQERIDEDKRLEEILGIKKGLPEPGSPDWKKWLNALADAFKLDDVQPDILEKAARSLFRKVFGFNMRPPDIENLSSVPCWMCKDRHLGFLPGSKVYWLDKPWLEPRPIQDQLRENGYALFLLELDAGRKAPEWLGITPLSSLFDVETPETGDSNGCEEIHKKYDDRRHALAALAKEKKPPEALPDLLVVKDLTIGLRPKKQGTVIEAHVAYWKQDNILFLKAQDSLRSLSIWLAAPVQENGGGLGVDANAIENLLKAKDRDEVLSRLREAGISQSELEAIQKGWQELPDFSRQRQPAGEMLLPNDVSGNKSMPQSRQTEAPEETGLPKISGRGHEEIDGQPHSAGNRGAGARSGMQSPGFDAIREGAGLKAQEWLRKRLNNLLLPLGWVVSESVERDSFNRETDIVLRHSGFNKEVHIEVKHVQTERIYWTRHEVSKAESFRDNDNHHYIIALVRNMTDEGVYWLLSPFHELVSVWRDVNVEWQPSPFRRAIQADAAPWSTPSPPPNSLVPEGNWNWSFVIQLPDEVGTNGVIVLKNWLARL